MNFSFLDRSPISTVPGTTTGVLSLPPPNTTPSSFADAAAEASGVAKLEQRHGTTTLAFKFDLGVIVAVDSRATMGPTISSNTVQKVIPVNSRVLGTLAGGAADCIYWLRNLTTSTRLFELEHDTPASVRYASNVFANSLKQYQGYGLSVASMIGGFDHLGPDLYMVTSGGERLQGDIFSVGSGSSFALGVLEANYRPDLTIEEAVTLGQAAIFHAQVRDGMSGGWNQVYLITAEGWKRVERVDAKDLADKFRLHFTEMDPFVGVQDGKY